MPATLVIEDANLSVAWARAFLEVMGRPLSQSPTIHVNISPLGDAIPETPEIRAALDRALHAHDCNSSAVSAMVVFPQKLRLRRESMSVRDFCNECLHRLLPRLKQLHPANRRGTYFERLMAFPGCRNGQRVVVNQLEEVIDRLRSGSRFRVTGLQMTCFNPATDHTRAPRLGFPCLQHVGLSYDLPGQLAIVGFYPSQDVFARAYGNYLGLAHLGMFIAREAGLTLRRVGCVCTHPRLGGKATKASLRSLREQMKALTRGA